MSDGGGLSGAGPLASVRSDDAVGGRLSWVTGAQRVRSLLAPHFGAPARAQVEGTRAVLEVSLGPSNLGVPDIAHAQDVLAVRPCAIEAVVSPWVAGGHVTLWLPDEEGVLCLRTPSLGAAGGALLVARPNAALRYLRRAEVRYVAPDPPDASVGCAVLVHDAWHAGRLVDVSASGLQLDLEGIAPADMPGPGTALKLSLQLGGPRAMELTAEVRHRTEPPGHRIGARFLSPTRLETLVLERFLARFAATARSERHTLEALPPVVHAALATANMACSVEAPPRARMPAAVLLTPLPQAG